MLSAILKVAMMAAEVAGVPGPQKKQQVLAIIPSALGMFGVPGGLTPDKLANPDVVKALGELIDAKKAEMNAEAKLKALGVVL